MKKWLGISLAGVAALAVAALGYWYAACPCERIPGVRLAGDVQVETVDDWSFANEPPRCYLMVQDGWRSHAITLNCYADASGDLFVSCSQCDGKYWSGVALREPAGWIRTGTDVYPVNFQRVLEPDRLDHSWAARWAKVGQGERPPRPGHWWSFHLTSRAPSAQI